VSIGSKIVTILKAESDITDMVGAGANARIRPKVLPEDTELPAILYTVVDFESITTKDSWNDWDNYNILIDSFAWSNVDAWTLAEHVRAALERKTGTVSGTTFHTVIFNGFREEDTDQLSTGATGTGTKIFCVSCDFNVIVN